MAGNPQKPPPFLGVLKKVCIIFFLKWHLYEDDGYFSYISIHILQNYCNIFRCRLFRVGKVLCNDIRSMDEIVFM